MNCGGIRSRWWLAAAWLAGWLVLAAASVRADDSFVPAPAAIATAPGEYLSIGLMTFGPGDEPYEKFGHNALVIINESEKVGVAFHWGAFDFLQPHFYLRFIQGRMIYQMRGEGLDGTVATYEYFKRSIYLQRLNLTVPQREKLRDMLMENAKPANREYRYDYYRDNCSTRVRDVLNKVLDNQLFDQSQGPAHGTFRWHTRRLTYQTPWLYIALDDMLGHAVDRPITRYQEMFLPMVLHDAVEHMQIRQDDGTMVPLVSNSREIFAGDHGPEPAAPARVTPWYLLAGIVLGGLLAVLGLESRRHWLLRWAYVLFTEPWLMLMGLGGTIMLFAWCFTDHLVTRQNENVLQVSILALALVLLLPMAALGKKVRWKRAYFYLTAIVAALSVLGLVLKVLPWFYQVNGDIIALCLPINLALLLPAWRMAYPRRPAAVPGNTAAAKPPGGKSLQTD